METSVKTLDIKSAVEHLFDEEIYLTGITEFGISWEDLTSGIAELLPQGARFNIAFEGRMTGDKIKGEVKGIDYLYVRPDGKFILNLQATILTDDGEMIHLQEDGILQPNEDGTAKLNLNMHFHTASQKYNWLNKKLVWGIGEVNMAKGVVFVKGYST